MSFNDIVHGAEKHRAYFYRVALSLVALAVVLHLVADGQVASVTELVAAILGVGGNGLAALNSSTKKDA